MEPDGSDSSQHHLQFLGQQSSVYRGVTFNKKSRKWQSVLNVSGSHVHLGTFNSEEDAAVAFDKAALIVRRDRARINFALANYLDAEGRIVEDASLKKKIESSCDPNRCLKEQGGHGWHLQVMQACPECSVQQHMLLQ